MKTYPLSTLFRVILIVMLALAASACDKVDPIDPDPTPGTALETTYFSTPRTLSKGEYLLDGIYSITAALVLEPGAVLRFKENARFQVKDGGSITAVGTVADPIIFKGTTAQKGWWAGLTIDANVANTLEYCQISDAGGFNGGTTEGSLILNGSGRASVKHCTFTNSSNYGIGCYSKTSLFTAYAANTVNNCTVGALHVFPVHLGQLDDTASHYSGGYIVVEEQTLDATTNAIWKKQTGPYRIAGFLYIEGHVTIEAGAELVFNEDVRMKVDGEDGLLVVGGSKSDPVTFRGYQATKGYWAGLRVSSITANSITHAVFRDAGGNNGGSELSSLNIQGKCSVTNCTFSNGEGYGIATADVSTPTFTAFSSNTITTHDKDALYINPSDIQALDGLGSTYSGNAFDYVRVADGTLSVNNTWPKLSVPYRIEDEIAINNGVTTLSPGVHIRFGTGVYGIEVKTDGRLVAVGTASEMIRFEGYNDVADSWGAIQFYTNSPINEIGYASFRNFGGSSGAADRCGVYLYNAAVKVHDCSFSTSTQCCMIGGVTNGGGNTTDGTTGSLICQ